MQSIRVGGQTEQKHSRRGSSEENVKIKIRTSSVAAFLLALHCSSVGLAGTHFESSQDFRATRIYQDSHPRVLLLSIVLRVVVRRFQRQFAPFCWWSLAKFTIACIRQERTRREIVRAYFLRMCWTGGVFGNLFLSKLCSCCGAIVSVLRSPFISWSDFGGESSPRAATI